MCRMGTGKVSFFSVLLALSRGVKTFVQEEFFIFDDFYFISYQHTKFHTYMTNHTLFAMCHSTKAKISLKGGGHSNLRCHDTFLKIVSLLENYRSEWGKSIHF